MIPMPSHIASVLQAYEDLMAEMKRIITISGEYMTPSAALLIAAIGDQPQTATEIMRLGMWTGTNPSYTISVLERDGYLIRCVGRNSKERLISLTPKGLSLAERIRKGLTPKSQEPPNEHNTPAPIQKARVAISAE